MALGEFASGVGRVPCVECKRTYSFTDMEPPCDTCFPGVHRFNLPFYTLYSYVAGQYIVGPGGVIALDAVAVDKFLDYFGVDLDERLEFQSKVQQISSESLRIQRLDADRQAVAAKNRG